MAAFGSRLRALRTAQGLRQVDVCEVLGIARPTLANLEAGRERPSARLWARLQAAYPAWARELADLYAVEASRGSAAVPGVAEAWPLGGPFDLERLTLCYVFGHARSPSEILEVRRVRARRQGAHGFGLRFWRDDDADFSFETEALWGGQLVVGPLPDGADQRGYLSEFRFDRTLLRGQRHEFAVRTFVERDPDPGTAVAVDFTIPAREVSIQLVFSGPETPRGFTVFGPLGERDEIPEAPGSAERTPSEHPRRFSAYFADPEPGAVYGIAWEW